MKWMPELNKKNLTWIVGGLTLAFILWLFLSCSNVAQEQPAVEVPAPAPVIEEVIAEPVEESIAPVEVSAPVIEEPVIEPVAEPIVEPVVEPIIPSDTTQELQ